MSVTRNVNVRNVNVLGNGGASASARVMKGIGWGAFQHGAVRQRIERKHPTNAMQGKDTTG